LRTDDSQTPTPADLAALAARLPAGVLSEDPELLAGYERDITGRFGERAAALARPRDRDEVIAVVTSCHALGIPLVAQGGNTGLVGGGVPRRGELVLSMRALDWLGEVDRDSHQLDAGAGATLESVQAKAAGAGLEFPLDHPARASATIGGGVATNAGGALALRHGTMRRRVVGLEAVTAEGAVVDRMAGLLKDNAGYDLPALLIGSEGTLAVLTAARLQLEPARRRRLTALFGIDDLTAALTLLGTLREVPGLEAADFFDSACMELVRGRSGLREPLGEPAGTYLIAQWATDEEVTEQLATALERSPHDPPVVVAEDLVDRKRLWAYRESINESIRSLGVAHKMDVAVPIATVPMFVAELRTRLERLEHRGELFLYGHLGDGNLHVNVVAGHQLSDEIDELVLRCTAEFGGTISAEHGVGLAKRAYLPLCRSADEIATMRTLKRALDPRGILGRGRVLDD
jgi:FAD/FMN-containing dehydrogenase